MVAAPNSPPSIAGTVTLTEPNYCDLGPGGTVSWIFSDPDGDTQSRYRVQIDEDPNFGSPIIDQTVNSPANSYPIQQSILLFGATYRTRVMVWDNQVPPNPSPWEVMSICNGPGCDPTSPQTYWDTPSHAYPDTNPGFVYSPPNPAQNQAITFDASLPYTICFASSGSGPGNPTGCAEWLWDFGDGLPPFLSNSSITQHAYVDAETYTVNLTVTDDQGYSCPAPPQNINVKPPVPNWREVLPAFIRFLLN